MANFWTGLVPYTKISSLCDTPQTKERAAVCFLLLGAPLFFPYIIFGLLPGPFGVGVSDSYIFFEPYARVFSDAVRNGENPFWNHQSAFGAPALLTLGTGSLHPFHLFHILMPDWLAFVVGLWARFALFSIYFYLYLRFQGVRLWIALSMVLALTYGSFFINYSFEIIGYVISFFPMALYHADKLCRNTSIVDYLLLSLAVACIILGGFPSVILYLLLALGLYIVFMASNLRLLIVAGVACFSGASIVLPVILETLSFYPKVGYDVSQRVALFFYDPPAFNAFNLVVPSIFGDLVTYGAAGMRDFYGSLLGAGVITLPIGVIISICVLLRIGAIGKLATFWLLTLCTSVVLYFNLFEIKKVIVHIPIFNEHPLTRMQSLIVISSTILSGLMLEQMMRYRWGRFYWLIILGTTGLLLSAVFSYLYFTIDNKTVSFNLTVFGVFSAFSIFALGWAAIKEKRSAYIAFIASNVAIGIFTSISYTFYFSPKDYYPDSRLISYVKENLVFGGRVLDVDNVLFKNTAIAYGVPSITNHWFSPPSLRDWVSSLSPDELRQGLTFDVVNTVDGKFMWTELRKMHVQFVALPCTQERALRRNTGERLDWKLVGRSGEDVCLIEVLYSGKALARNEGISGSGYTRYFERAGAIQFRPEKTGVVTLPVRYYDGWYIAEGANEIGPNQVGLIRVLPSDESEFVELKYFPSNFYFNLLVGSAVFGICLILIYLVMSKTVVHASKRHC